MPEEPDGPELPAEDRAEGHDGLPPDPFTRARESAATMAELARWLRTGDMPVLLMGAYMAAYTIFSGETATLLGDQEES